jgi:hypothetical protein
MSEEVELEIILSSNWWDEPPIAEIYIDDILLEPAFEVTEKKIENKSRTLKYTVNLSEGPRVLRLCYLNKEDKHTQIDEAGNILQDQILNLEDLSIDGISLNYLNFKLGKFIPDLTKRDWLPPVITGQCSFGHCGEWQMEFAVPTYLWLLENF